MKYLLVILLFTIGFTQEKVVNIDTNELTAMKHTVDSLKSVIELNKVKSIHDSKFYAEIGYMEGQMDALNKKVRITEVIKDHYTYLMSPWDDDTKCILCGDTIKLPLRPDKYNDSF